MFDGNAGLNGNWWSSTESAASTATKRNLNYNHEALNVNQNSKSNANSVRCLRDSLPLLLYSAYTSARKHKRFTHSQLMFELDLERNLNELASELERRAYRISPSVCFITDHPVKREIIAADFRDRVVEHLLFNELAPIFERKFIHDSYSCRMGKGVHFGIDRARGFLRAVSDDFRHEAWVLKLDISGYFMSICQRTLYEQVQKVFPEVRSSAIRELMDYIAHKIIFHNPMENAIFKSSKSSWNGLPRNKSMLNSVPGTGLPIGNVTSQLFGNVYLNPLDHYVKRDLHIKYYGRYVDDFFLMHKDREYLLRCMERIRFFLKERLNLTLHPRKWSMQRACHGFKFLGAYILPGRVYPNHRVESVFFRYRKSKNVTQSGLDSYRGYFSHFDCYRRMVRNE